MPQDLIVENLSVSYTSINAKHAILQDVSFAMSREKLAVVGGSGAGKSILAKALLGLLPEHMTVHATTLSYQNTDLQVADQIKTLRGKTLAYIPQDAKIALNPILTIGYQLQECIIHRLGLSAAQATAAACDALAEVELHHPQRLLTCYPHELSGGMAQRVMIAMMLIGQPKLVIADEPTSALDSLTAQAIVELLHQLVEQQHMSLIFISHHIQQTLDLCDRVMIMQQGRIVEISDTDNIMRSTHPYVKTLIACIPDRQQPRHWLPTYDKALIHGT